MAIKIAHASIDENGSVKNGNAGDQTRKEVCVRTWYSKPWQYVIRFKDANMREKVAIAMEYACNNNNIGYDQNQRNTLLTKARSVEYDPSKVTAKCETDCSALVTLACIYAGIPETSLFISGNSATTTTLRSRLIKTGKVEVFNSNKYTSSDNYLLRGDILLREGSHVVVAIENGSKITATKKTVEKTSKPVVATPTLRKGSKNKQVKYLQQDLNYLLGSNLLADGIFGTKTASAVKAFQKKYGLGVDGIYGQKSYSKMKDLLT